MGIKVAGTLGVLVVVVERKIIQIGEVELLLVQMIDYGYCPLLDNLSRLFPRHKK
jgi:predicted nucleic acid-binding protein